MQTEFEFLRRLESELTDVARAEAHRAVTVAPTRRRRHWRGWITAAASLLVVAGVIGVIVQSSGIREFAVSENSGQFSSVGSAVGAATTAPRIESHAPAPAADIPGLTEETGGVATGPGRQGQSSGTTAPSADLSKIIRDGQIAVTIDDGSFAPRSAEVSRIAAANGGSILSSSTSGGDSGTFTLRIPASTFDRAMVQLSRLGTVDSSEVHGQDVTAQYVDLKAHMKIYVARRKVLFGLMQQANTLGETLSLQGHLDDVQLKIDQIQGQLNFINKQVAVSTIKVDLHEPDAAVETTPGEVENPSLGRAWDRAVQGFLNVLTAVVIGLGYLIPIAVVVAIAYWITQLVRRRRTGATDAG